MRDTLTGQVIGAAIEVHRTLGPGLLESAYERCLHWELKRLGLAVERQIQLPVSYKGLEFEEGYRLDLVVDERLVVELKTVEHLLPIHEAQLLTYLKLSNKQTGLLINFNVPFLRDGIKRMVL
ncbi:MAG: GxxExxY protein [Phycisphaeraceae bacterium]